MPSGDLQQTRFDSNASRLIASTVRPMRALAVVLALFLVACGGDESRSLEEWLVWENGGGEDPEQVDCVAGEMRQALTSGQIDELAGTNLASMSEDEMMQDPEMVELLGAHADAHFACVGGWLGEP